MRNLIVLRGSMGSGKSTWVQNNGLEPFVLSPDNIRLMFSSPQMQINSTDCTINQNNDTKVWDLLFTILEDRMKNGEFTIIDATHSKQSDFSRYNHLCEKYRYRRYYVDFTDIPIEVCKEQNKNRKPTWKKVLETAIDKCYARFSYQKPASGWTKIDRDQIQEFLRNKPYDLNQYDKIHIFGDIHGCYEPLKEYLDTYAQGLPENEMFIFTGDYLDRGIQNKETMELLCQLCTLPNTLFLPGNHEEWLRMFVFDDIDLIRSREFIHKTMYDIKDIPHQQLANFVRKLGQIAYFTYDNQEYFISHGGVPYIPEHMALVSMQQFISGVGKFSDDIDKIYSENHQDIIQIHGHRNTFGIDTDAYPGVYNLEGSIEFGGNLRVLVLQHNQKPQCVYIKNNVYRQEETKVNNDITDIISTLRNHNYVKETDLGNHISSFNFTRDAFYNKCWDSITVKTRGLFMNVDTEQVVARAYDKFFHINEREETKLINIRKRMEDEKIPALAYKKYNGYLGIASYYNDELHFHSKSTDQGDFANWFKEIFMSQYKPEQIQFISDYSRDYNCSFIYEVIDPVNDPHIIKNEQREIILLDVINNSLECTKMPYSTLLLMAHLHDFKCKEIVATFEDFRSLMQFYLEHTDEENMNDTDIEGVVVEIGDFMFKMKFNYYNFWKSCRGIKEKLRLRHNIKLGELHNKEMNDFYAWLKGQPTEVLEKDIITLREMFLAEEK